jgi:hypothetical protein
MEAKCPVISVVYGVTKSVVRFITYIPLYIGWRKDDFLENYCYFHYVVPGARSSLVVNALCYKQEGQGFDIRLGDL